MLPDLIDALPDCVFNRLSRWLGITPESWAWLFDD
jgi:hypothetical protein